MFPDSAGEFGAKSLPPPHLSESRPSLRSISRNLWIALMESAMEVDTKETVPDRVVTFNDLPNEILVMVFRRLETRKLLEISLVCNRWNEVVFNFLSDRIVYRMWTLSVPVLSEKRIYRNVKFTGRFYSRPQALYEDRLANLGEHVRDLNLELLDARGSILARVLEKFPALRSLRLKVAKYLNDKSSVSFRRMIDGLLPGLEHLTILCQGSQCTELLAEVAPTLKSLDVSMMARHRLKLYQCNFTSLESLTLVLDIRSMLYLYNLKQFPSDELIMFLAEITTLRTLRLTIDDSETFKLIYGFKNLVELSLSGLEPPNLKCSLDGVSQMTNLRSLSIKAREVLLPFSIQPMSTVTSLKLLDTDQVDLRKLVKLFPNLTVFYLSQIVCEPQVYLIVSSWPRLEELLLTLVQLSKDNAECFWTLPKLRKLVLHGKYVLYDPLPLEKITYMPSMKRIDILDSACSSFNSYRYIRSTKDWQCDVYFNGVRVNVVDRRRW